MLNYLNNTLGISAREQPFEGTDRLPPYLRKGREYRVLTVAGRTFLLIRMFQAGFNLSAFMKQRQNLAQYWDGEMILCFDALTPYQRKALISAGISFIVPGSQLFLPCMGIALQERMPAPGVKPTRLTASGQLLFLYMLYAGDDIPSNKVSLAKQLEVSAMTVTRAVQELQALGLVETERRGRCDYVSAAAAGRELYEKARPYLINPVQERKYAVRSPFLDQLPLSGESAVAERSMLNPPAISCRAVDRHLCAARKDIEYVDPAWYGHNDYVELEIWKYDPCIFSRGEMVDVVYLAASLADCRDERVEAAVEEMMEAYEW